MPLPSHSPGSTGSSPLHPNMAVGNRKATGLSGKELVDAGQGKFGKILFNENSCHLVILFDGLSLFHYCLVDLHAKVSSSLFDSHKHLISLFQIDYRNW